MLIRQGAHRSFVHDRRLACTWRSWQGRSNSAGFYAVGVFSANMTGNVSIMADRFALGALLPGLFYLAILATFVLGAAVSALITNAGERHHIHAIYALAVLAEAALLAILGFADLWLAPGLREPTLIFGLSFSMGLQNAIVTRISAARVRTTHISGMATDLGIEIGCLLDIALHGGGRKDARPLRERLLLHGATILSFCLGGIAGVVTYRACGAWLLFGAAALLLMLSVPSLLRWRMMTPRTARG